MRFGIGFALGLIGGILVIVGSLLGAFFGALVAIQSDKDEEKSDPITYTPVHARMDTREPAAPQP